MRKGKLFENVKFFSIKLQLPTRPQYVTRLWAVRQKVWTASELVLLVHSAALRTPSRADGIPPHRARVKKAETFLGEIH